MALDAEVFARKIHDSLSQKADGHGAPTTISTQTLNQAKGIVAALKAATVSNVPGTITGTTAPGSPLSGGAGTNGLMVILSAPMKAITSVGLPPQALPKLNLENDALIAYIGTANIVFSSGGITGTCTNTASSPGPLTSGAGSEGKLTGITGAGAAAAVAGATGLSGPDMKKHYDVIINYLLDKAEVAYASGSIVGVCPPGGGPLSLGAGTGGKVS